MLDACEELFFFEQAIDREKESVREVKERLHDLRAAELSRIQEVSGSRLSIIPHSTF